MRGREQPHDLRLELVRVLVLVHHHVAVLLRELAAQLFAPFQSFAQADEQVVVGQEVARALELLEGVVQLFEGRALVREMRVRLLEHLLQRADLVDHHAEDRADGALAREAPLFGEVHLTAQQVDEVFGVARVEHGEVALDARRLGELAQHVVAEAVEGAARDPLAARVAQRGRAREHPCRRAPREGEQQDGLGPRARLDEARHAVDERARLARARPGDDEERAVGRRHRLELGRVQLLLVIDPAGARRGREAFQDQPGFGLRGHDLSAFEVVPEGFEFRRELFDCLVALLRHPVERPGQDALKVGRQLRLDRLAQPRLLVQDGVHRVDLVLVDERARARQHLAEDDAEGEDVAAQIDALAEQLLGRHVADRAHDRAGLGVHAERGLRAVGGEHARAAGGEFRQSEVENLRVAVAADHQVFRLQVAVDDARLVGLRQPLGDLDGDVQRVLDL